MLTKEFGNGILGEDGRLDRTAFAQKIFKDPKVLTQVNAILHPLTWQAIQRKIHRLSKEAEVDLIVVESALFQEESKKICDFFNNTLAIPKIYVIMIGKKSAPAPTKRRPHP